MTLTTRGRVVLALAWLAAVVLVLWAMSGRYVAGDWR